MDMVEFNDNKLDWKLVSETKKYLAGDYNFNLLKVSNLFYLLFLYQPKLIILKLLSDHLPSFLIIPKINAVKLPKNHNLYTRNMDNFDRENFILDLIAVDKIASDNNVNCAFSDILESTNNIIDKYIITKEEYKIKYKPWITRCFKKAMTKRINFIDNLSSIKTLK